MKALTWTTKRVKLKDLIEWDKNPVQISERDAKELAKSLDKFDHVLPYVAAAPPNGRKALPLLDGHQRKMVELQLNKADPNTMVDVRIPSRRLTDKERQEIVVRLRKNTGEFDFDKLANYFEVPDLLDWGFDEKELTLEGFEFGDESQDAEPKVTLAERFGVPPFSVLDARQGYWQERKRAWIGLGIQSEVGRGDTPGTSARSDEATYRTIRRPNAAPGGSPRDAATLKDGHTQRGDGTGKPIKNGLLGFSEQARSHYKKADARAFGSGGAGHEWQREVLGDVQSPQSGTSIFDPVLCELAYRWFSPEGGAILDPFAGGSVRGVVAAKLGKQYTGIDLSARQIEANEVQAQEITPDNLPRWIVGDSRNAKDLAPGEYDLIFSCPPYFDLEVYSDDPADLSTMDYAEFIGIYREIIAACVSMLKDNRFACFVVGDIRDKKGFYRNFVSDTISAFQDAGAILYNEAILVTAVGSLPIRIGRQFEGYRKLGKTHQNVLVFYKGNPKAIKNEFGIVETVDLAEQYGEIA